MASAQRLTACFCTVVLLLVAAVPGAVATSGEGRQEDPQPRPQVMADGVIVPGQRIGPVRLTMSLEQIVAAVGSQPTRDEFREEGIILYEWRAEGLWVSHTMTTKAIRVISVFGTSGLYRTEKGISLTDTRAKAEAVYGKNYKKYEYPVDRITLIRYPDLGLQFGVVNQPSNPVVHNRIFQIGIFRPGDLPPLRKPS